MYLFQLLCIYFSIVCSFLLEPQNQQATGGQLVGSGQYVTVSQFYEQVKQDNEELHSQTEQLRHYTDNSLALLTAQIQQRFANLEKQLLTNNHCKCNDSHLEKNYAQLETTLNDILFKFAAQELELRNKTIELEKLQTLLLLNENRLSGFDKKIIMLDNNTAQLTNEIANLNQLKAIQALQDFLSLQQQVQSLSSDTHSLSVNEKARSQDFLALYNKALASENTLTNLQTIFNTTLVTLETKIDGNNKRLDSLETTFNTSLSIVKQEINQSIEKVTVSACVLDTKGLLTLGEVIKFGDVLTDTGINNIAAFIASGKFTCEKDGLYLISAYIYSYTIGAKYEIYKNGQMLSRVYISDNPYNTGTGVVSVELHTGDTIWVTTAITMFIHHSRYSCLTVIKIK